MHLFKIYGIWPQAHIHAHNFRKCSHASVGARSGSPQPAPINARAFSALMILLLQIYHHTLPVCWAYLLIFLCYVVNTAHSTLQVTDEQS